MTTLEIKQNVKIPKNYRRLRIGEIIPNDYLCYVYKKMTRDIEYRNKLMTPLDNINFFGSDWVGERIDSDGWTPFFIKK